MQAVEKIQKAFGSGSAGSGRKTRIALEQRQLGQDIPLDIPRLAVPAAEAQPHHRMRRGPVPVRMDVQTPEQGLVSLEQALQCVEQQALAEPARPGEEIVAPLVHQPPDKGGLVHITKSLAADRPEILDPDRKQTARHGSLHSRRRPPEATVWIPIPAGARNQGEMRPRRFDPKPVTFVKRSVPVPHGHFSVRRRVAQTDTNLHFGADPVINVPFSVPQRRQRLQGQQPGSGLLPVTTERCARPGPPHAGSARTSRRLRASRPQTTPTRWTGVPSARYLSA